MNHQGSSHIGLYRSTLDLDKIREFYEAFWVLISNRRHDKNQRRRAPSTHLFRCRARPADRLSGTAGSVSPPASIILLSRQVQRDELRARGVETTDIVDHG